MLVNEKKIQENGFSELETLAIEKYKLIPFLLTIFIFYDYKVVEDIISFKVFCLLFACSVISLTTKLLKITVLNSVASLSFLLSFRTLVNVPFWILFGYLINGEILTTFGLFGILLLIISYLIRPKTQGSNELLYGRALLTVSSMIIATSLLSALYISIYKVAIIDTGNILMLVSIYGVLRSTLIYFCCLTLPSFNKNRRIKASNNNIKIVFLICFFSFFGHLSQAIALEKVTILAFGIITSCVSLIDYFSDVKQGRIEMNIRSASFITLYMIATLITTTSFFS